MVAIFFSLEGGRGSEGDCKRDCNLVLLTEYSTEVSEVFQSFITLKPFSLQIHAKTKFKTSNNLKR